MNNKSYPNQKHITICKASKDYSTTNKHYMIVDNEALITLMKSKAVSSKDGKQKDISLKAIKLYLYLMMNKDNYQLYLSAKDVIEKCGMSESSYHNAVNELIDHRYLIQTGNNSYKLMEYPLIDTMEKGNSTNTNSKVISMYRKAESIDYDREFVF